MVLDHYEKSKYQKVSVLQKINLFNEGVNGKSRPRQRTFFTQLRSILGLVV